MDGVAAVNSAVFVMVFGILLIATVQRMLGGMDPLLAMMRLPMERFFTLRALLISGWLLLLSGAALLVSGASP